MTATSLFIKRSIKSAASLAKGRLGLPRPIAGSVNILAYHRVVNDIDRAERDAIYGIVISAASFRHHCELLKRSFDVVSLGTAMHFLESRRRVSRPLAVLTFDDGYLDFYDVAFPILNDLGIPATVFLPTAQIGQNKPLAHDRIYWLLKNGLDEPHTIIKVLRQAGITKIADREVTKSNLLGVTSALVYLPHAIREDLIIRLENALPPACRDYPVEYGLLNWELVREMGRKGINFGSHTSNHVVLPLENNEVINDEIRSSKAELEQELGTRVISFAYPNGEYTGKIRRAVSEAGFTLAVTTENKTNLPGADRFTLGRTSLCEESTRGIRGTYSPAVAKFRLGA
jgi:peptidoglycan/xylan/chitin deacetylase (PgdA/CDA1 family)